MFGRRRSQPSPDPPRLHRVPAIAQLQPVEDVYLLFLNRPPDDVPADDGGATVVPAPSLHHPELPQPDAHRLLERLIAHPDRYPGALVFLSDLTAELAREGLSWPQVGIDYEAVTDTLVALYRRGGCKRCGWPNSRPSRSPSWPAGRTPGSTAPRRTADHPSCSIPPSSTSGVRSFVP